MANNQRTIGVLHKNPKTFEAIKASMEPFMSDVKFVHISNQGELNKAEDISEIACVGMPSFPADHKRLTIHSFSTEYTSDPKAQARNWSRLNDIDAEMSAIYRSLSKPKLFTLIPENVATENADAFAELDQQISEAVTSGDTEAHIELLSQQVELSRELSCIGGV